MFILFITFLEVAMVSDVYLALEYKLQNCDVKLSSLLFTRSDLFWTFENTKEENCYKPSDTDWIINK